LAPLFTGVAAALDTAASAPTDLAPLSSRAYLSLPSVSCRALPRAAAAAAAAVDGALQSRCRDSDDVGKKATTTALH